MSNPLDYDKFGHCTICSKNLVSEVAINGKIESRFTPDFNEVKLILSDNSKMRVCMCSECKNNFSQDKYVGVMNKVKKAWEMEVDKLNWDDQRKSSHIERMNQLSISSQV